MTPEKLAFINLVARLGLEVAATVWTNVGKAASVDDAIEALRKSQQLTAADYGRERQP